MTEEVATLLREIRDQQRLQLERQAEALAVQREQFGLYQKQLDRVDRINDRAERIQQRAGKASKLALWIILPLLALVLLTMLWPYVRYIQYWLS
jgi:ABC-type uncharacterized transport system involved in gliding motility auxiliary subunit